MTLTRRMAAEFLGTSWLVLGGCGSAVLADATLRCWFRFPGVSTPV